MYHKPVEPDPDDAGVGNQDVLLYVVKLYLVPTRTPDVYN